MDGGWAMESRTADALRAAAAAYPTPAYVYDIDLIVRRIGQLREAFGGRFEISYAVKANPNRALIQAIAPHVDGFDVSSLGEAGRVRRSGVDKPVSFTGPGKSDEALRRFAVAGAGHVVLESLDEAESLSELILRHGLAPQPVLLRINPVRVPRQFGASMAGRGGQFGVDEEVVPHALGVIARLGGLRLDGFHCYPATNGLQAEAVGANLAMMAELFQRSAAGLDRPPGILVFGAGFGIPYGDGEDDLDLAAVAAIAAPRLDALRGDPGFASARFVLELGRWIVGPAGHLLTRVVRTKASRGQQVRICDAGFNAHMAACGMLGGAFRRNWRIANLSNPGGPPETCDLAGPLCTTLDRIASDIALPQVRKGDVLAIAQSGAYGLTASPTRFISHPEPLELALLDGRIVDITEGRAGEPAGPLAA
jgi:diaminopimelate decarboxylase